MQALERVLQSVKNRRYDDDFIDRANYVFTPVMLASFAITVAAKQYVGQPLQCWVPAHFTGTWESYSESYCFVENTYYVAMTERFPTAVTDREKRQLHYYQWVPFILAAQLLLFFLPKMMWHTFNWKTGINMNALCVAARPVKKKDHKHVLKTEMQTDVRQAVQHLSTALQYQQRKTRSHQGGGSGTAASRIAHRNAMNIDGIFSMSYDDFPPKVTNNNYRHLSATVPETADADMTLTQSSVTYYYLAFKALNLSVAVFELFLLNRCLGATGYRWWGWGVLGDLLNNRQWHQSGHFPRVTFCDVTVREQGGHHVPHTLQCVLMLNMFNEKIFIFVWFWLLLLAVVDAVNLAYWVFGSLNTRSAIRFIKSHLSTSIDDEDVGAFVQDALGRDGVTALRLIAHNCGDLAANLIVESVWKSHWASASAQLTAAVSDAMHHHHRHDRETAESPAQLKPVPTHQPDAVAQALKAHRQLRARLTELAQKRAAEQQQVEKQLAEKLQQQQQELLLPRKQQQRESILSVGSDGYISGAGYYSSCDGHQQAEPLPPKQQLQSEMPAIDGNNNNNNSEKYNNNNNIVVGGESLFAGGATIVPKTTNNNNNGRGDATVMGDDTLYFDEEADLRLVGDHNNPPTTATNATIPPSVPINEGERIGEVRYLA